MLLHQTHCIIHAVTQCHSNLQLVTQLPTISLRGRYLARRGTLFDVREITQPRVKTRGPLPRKPVRAKMPRTESRTYGVVSHNAVSVWESVSNRNVQTKEKYTCTPRTEGPVLLELAELLGREPGLL